MKNRKLFFDPNLQVVFAVTLMAVLGVSSLAPALPKVIEHFGIGPREVGWLITAFTFPGVVLALLLGVLADRIGRKKILVPSLLLFGVAGGACAFAETFETLIALRFVQGIGGSALSAINVTVIGDLYRDPERGAAMGYNSSVLSVGTASYPFIGGSLASLGWQYPFLLPLVAIPVGLLVLFGLKSPEPKNDMELKRYLILTFRSMKDRRALVLFLIGVVTFIILYGSALTYFPILMSERFGSSTFVIGLLMSSMSVATAVVASQIGRLIAWKSEKILIMAGMLLYALAMVLIPLTDGVWLMVIPVMIYGVGNALNLPSQQTKLAGLAPLEYRGAFMAANGMLLRLGQTIGPLLMGVFYLVGGLSGPFFAGAGLALLMVPIVGILLNDKKHEDDGE
jgi:MFS transporter, ACDE family, multidrug resistance protein